MKVIPIKTHKIAPKEDLFKILDKYIPDLHEKTIVAITSKIISITQGRVVKIDQKDKEKQKDRLIEQEAQYYLDRSENPYKVSLTIANNSLVATAGIDESNGNGSYVLWPKDPQAAANKIREYIGETRGIRDIGVIITDSKTTPLRWGVTGFALSYSGFVPLKDYIGTKDLFGRKFEYEKLNIADSLAAAATVVMGEGAEQTPIAIIREVRGVRYVERNPTEDELKSLKISLNEDLYAAPILKSVKWKKGKKNSQS